MQFKGTLKCTTNYVNKHPGLFLPDLAVASLALALLIGLYDLS